MKTSHLVGLCLMLALVGSSVAAPAETDYFAVFMDNMKVGHAIHTRLVSDGTVTTTENVTITLNRDGITVSMNMRETSIETADGKPLGFETVQNMSMMTMKITGVVDKQGNVTVTTTGVGQQQKQTFPWPNGALMAEGLRLLGLKKGLKEGLSYTAKVFDLAAMQVLEARVQIGAKKNIDMLGRVVPLTEITTTISIPGAGQIVNTAYVDDELKARKSITPLAGIQIEIVACAKDFALSEDDVLDVVEKMFLPSPKPLGDVSSAKSITYHLSPKDRADTLTLPSGDNQTVRPGRNGGLIVIVSPISAPTGAKFPYKGTDKAILEATMPTRFLQSDRKEIIALARDAIENTKDAAEAARKIEAFVAEYIENKSLSVGYASAAEVAVSRQGDCSEFAVLTASMCRAVGIPAQVVMGIAYVKDFAGLQDRFGGHAWTRACIGGKWIGLDAAFKSAGLGGFDAGHIAQAYGSGDPEDFYSLISSVGKFKIDAAIVNTGR